MQSNDAIEVVAPLGGGVSQVTLFPNAAAKSSRRSVSEQWRE